MKIHTINNFLSNTEIKNILEYSLNNLELKSAGIMGPDKKIINNLDKRK